MAPEPDDGENETVSLGQFGIEWTFETPDSDTPTSQAAPAPTPDTKELILMQANDLFSSITTQLIADIEAGTGTWKMPWHSLADIGTPVRADGRPYRSMNALWLAISAAAASFSQLTSEFRSCRDLNSFTRRFNHDFALLCFFDIYFEMNRILGLSPVDDRN